MNENVILILPVLFPILMGILVLMGKRFQTDRNSLIRIAGASFIVETALVGAAFLSGSKGLTLWQLTDSMSISFRIDAVAMLFAGLTTVMWVLVGFYAFVYMTHEENENQFFGWYLIVLGVLAGLDFSANLITFYVFYELMTLTSLPLVLHERTKEAVMAGLKYLFYSIAGAFMALFGIFFLTTVTSSLDFTPGGVLDMSLLAGKEGLLLAALFLMIVGFGTKAGMFPLHGWLPTAHPVAPAPASAVLSGVITKAGVLAVVRVVYYIVGPEVIRGTWVQYGWIILSLMTVFMGSMLAYKEPVLKKRLAYSTVSQVSYIMFGLSVLHPVGFIGALLHVVFHSVIKNGLFMSAGAVIFTTGWTKVGQMRGLGKIMPKTLVCYTAVALGLIGIPSMSGFISKWYLAQGSLASGTGAFAWAGPVILLISALLTAGYLLPLTIQGFFPGADFDESEIKERGLEGKEPSKMMLIPIAVTAFLTLLLGCFPVPLLRMLEEIAGMVF